MGKKIKQSQDCWCDKESVWKPMPVCAECKHHHYVKEYDQVFDYCAWEKHTPGPWTIALNDYDSTLEVISRKGKPIASVYTENLLCEWDFTMSKEEAMANATIIAAAPEMLLALERARDYIKHMGDSKGHIFDLPSKLKYLEKVIAKAEGEDIDG